MATTDTHPVPHAPVESQEAEWDAAEAQAKSSLRRKNIKLLGILAAVGLGMLGFAYANAPLWTMLCGALGFSISPNSDTVAGAGIETDRTVQVTFHGNVSGQLPVTFRILERRQDHRLGQFQRNEYTLINMSNDTVYIMPVHSIRPTTAATDEMFQLAECFCFDPVKLNPKQRLALPIVYRFSPEMADNVQIISMNYTLFPIDRERYEKEMAKDPETRKQAILHDGGFEP